MILQNLLLLLLLLEMVVVVLDVVVVERNVVHVRLVQSMVLVPLVLHHQMMTQQRMVGRFQCQVVARRRGSHAARRRVFRHRRRTRSSERMDQRCGTTTAQTATGHVSLNQSGQERGTHFEYFLSHSLDKFEMLEVKRTASECEHLLEVNNRNLSFGQPLGLCCSLRFLKPRPHVGVQHGMGRGHWLVLTNVNRPRPRLSDVSHCSFRRKKRRC